MTEELHDVAKVFLAWPVCDGDTPTKMGSLGERRFEKKEDLFLTFLGENCGER